MMSGLETPKQDFAPRGTNRFSWEGSFRRNLAVGARFEEGPLATYTGRPLASWVPRHPWRIGYDIR